MDITSLKKTLAKDPKSLLFAQYAEVLRQAGSGNDQKLNEALLVANKGLEANPNFLLGRLVRGRILMDKGNLSGARIDFEAVARRDSFCVSAQKSLLEISKKFEQPPDSDAAQILNALDSGYEATHGSAKPAAAQTATLKSVSVSDALDNILEEEEVEERKTQSLLIQAVDSIIESTIAEPPATAELSLPKADSIFDKEEQKSAPIAPQAPSIDSIVNEQLKDRVENLPDLTGDINSLLTSNAPALEESSLAPAPVETSSAPQAPDIDSIINEQLTSRVENLPDLTGDINSLLTSNAPAADEYAFPPMETLETLETPAAPQAPDIDSIINEQLTDRVENLPDLTNDINSLLTSNAPAADEYSYLPETSTSPTVEEYTFTPMETVETMETSPEPQAPSIDSIVNEQLTDRVENLPDLTSDIDSLLTSNAEVPEEYSFLPETSPAPQAPDIDSIINEQLMDRLENLPDLTGDINSLLNSNAPDQEEYSFPATETPLTPQVPSIDSLVNEQLMDRVENLPDLTNDMNSLLEQNEFQDEDIFAQNPTETLAEIYINQGLPQKAVNVYKTLLASDPNNSELKEKLDLAEKQI